MKFIKESTVTILIVLFIIYAAINLIHLSWILAEPEGFWGFFYFLKILGVIVLAVTIAITVIVFLFYSLLELFSDFPKNLILKNILKPVGIALLLIVFLSFNAITGSGISIYIYKKVADRYSYINKTEKLFDEGKFVKAIKYSKKAYQKYGKPSAPSQFYILSYLFHNTDYGNKLTLTKQYATTINYAYCLDLNNSDLDFSEKLYNDALDLTNSPFLANDLDYKIFPLTSLAQLNLDRGNYQKAEKCFNTLLQYSNQASKDDIEYISIAQEIFASYYIQVGDLNKAKILRKNNLKIWEENKKSLKSLTYLMLLLSATSSEIISQDFDEVGNYLIKAQPLAEKRSKKAVYPAFLLMKGIYCNYVSIYGNGKEEIIEKGWGNKIAALFRKSKTTSEKFKEEAEVCFLEILNFEKNANGNKSLGYMSGLHRLAFFYLENGEEMKANRLLIEAKEISEKYKSSNIQWYNTILLAYTISEYRMKGFEIIKNNLQELEHHHFNKLLANYTFLTEKERETYKNLVDNNIKLINSIYISTNSADTRKKLYNNIIATREIALYANENIRNYLGNLNDSLQKEYYHIIKQRDSIEIHKNLVANPNEKVSNDILLKEKAIQTKISSMPGFVQFDPREVSWGKISAALKENEIAIEFIHSKLNKKEQYYALVIKKELVAPELIPLFEESVLKNLLNQPGNTKERTNAVYDKLKDSLYSLIWKPLGEKLTNVQKAYISVSGILYGVSFPAMLNDKNLDIILLGSTRQVAFRAENPGKQYSKAALFGGVNYGKSFDSTKNIGGNRNNFSNLPFTIEEVFDIKQILQHKLPEIHIDLLTEDSASELSFRNLVKRKPNLIHLATHGYYYSGNNFSNSNLLTELYSATNLNPMLKSGIVLAGANNRLGSDSENDGFLSAQEIARLNFENLDLAVLSACETGLGETIGSEGVFGLQRAFKLAGANSLIMSLWKVPDLQTAELMALFYDNYMKGMTKSLALKEAQLTMKNKYNDTFSWGGFILLER